MSNSKSKKRPETGNTTGSDPVVFGHNTLQRIVAVQLLNESTVRMYTRGDSDKNRTNASASSVSHSDAEFFPFFFLSSPTLIEGFHRKYWIKELAGSNFYRFLVAFQRWNDLWEAIRFLMQTYNRTALRRASHYSEIEPLFLKADPLTQYLLQSGVTLFKGMEFGDLLRIQIQIHTFARTGRRSDPRRTEDRILAAVLTDNTGWEATFDGRKLPEKEILQGVASAIQERDPDIVEGHEISDFVLPFLVHRS